MVKKKISMIIFIVGVALLITAPILGYFLDKSVLYERKPVVIDEDSDDGLQSAFAYPFSIGKDQKITIEFSVYYANVTATLKILGKGYYDQQKALNSTPGGLTGQDFVYSRFVRGQSPSADSDDERSITYNGYWYIEFAGDTDGGYLISIPGSYVIVVYGDNDGPPADTDVLFNIVIKKDGPGDFLEELFYYLGAGVIAALVLFISYSYYKKFKGGR
ncbi:MAG: hypothetical protein E3J52_07850 [Promethearchaeota archaeon]|nr:MAG: hypothetical protein E3J52_07850 [Candidatus Lokiarchaeota archaeon]